ncbi:MAG: hypothetical protein ACRDDZ_05905 [Marinifilaceae bacterium]
MAQHTTNEKSAFIHEQEFVVNTALEMLKSSYQGTTEIPDKDSIKKAISYAQEMHRHLPK